MESRAAFKQVSEYDLRSTAPNMIDTGIIPTPVTSQTTNGPTLRGVETNTARGVKEAVVLEDIIKLEHAPATDAPPVEGFKTYGEI